MSLQRPLAAALLAAVTLLPSAPVLVAQTRPPLSASDWLSGTVEAPPQHSGWRPGDATPPDANDRRNPDLATSGAVEPVGVSRLDQGNADATGTVSARSAGLPADLWGASDVQVLAELIRAQDPQLPALRRLLRRVLAARLDPPAMTPAGAEGRLFLARIDKLLDMGATGAAQDLLLAAGPGDPERFRRLFDIALLAGDEARACQIMDRTPGIAPSFAARTFCLAFGGDWAAAALVYTGAEQLGRIDGDTALLMAHYLDDAYADSAQALPPPETVTPLAFRLHEAIGQPLATGNLPLAFVLSDLDDSNGWKARLDAAERLARVGAIPASHLRAIYVLQRPAASGGVWDRAATIQQLTEALAARDRDGVTAALPMTFDAMNRAGLGHALAEMAGAESATMELSGRAGVIALWLALAAHQTDLIEVFPDQASEFDRWLVSFASGNSRDPLPDAGRSGAAAILAPAFMGDAQKGLHDGPAHLIAENRRGEALLGALADIDAGLEGNLVRAAIGLRTLRALGQEDIARQAAVELMLTPQILPLHAGDGSPRR